MSRSLKSKTDDQLLTEYCLIIGSDTNVHETDEDVFMNGWPVMEELLRRNPHRNLEAEIKARQQVHKMVGI